MRNFLFKIFAIALLVIYIPSFGGAWGGSVYAQWKAYLSYYEPTEIEQASDGMLYVLASGGLYSYNPSDQQLTTYDKTTVLSDCGISQIAWCQSARRLVIVYDDYNIDLLSPNGNVVNMPAYMNTSMTVDKSVNNIDINGRNAYLSTSFGIVQINVGNAEFSNTYNLGFRVDYTYTDNQYIYAASSTNGLYRASLSSNLLDPNQWTRIANYTARPKTMDANLLAIVKTLNPGGPKYNYFGEMKFKYGNLYTVTGGYGPAIELDYPGAVQVLRNNGDWQIYQDSLQKITNHSYVDNLCIDVDPRDTSHVFVGGRTGLYEFRSGRYVGEYNIDNSPLQCATEGRPSKNYVLIEGITFDNNGHLWVLNSAAENQSLFEFANGEFTSHHSRTYISPENNRSLYSMVSPFIDSRNILWFGNRHWYTPGLFYYNINNGQAGGFTNITNEDGTSYEISVRSVTEDKNNNIWIGASRGTFMLEPSEMSNANPVFTQVKVPRNDGTDYADYLLSGVDIRAIYVDKGNRKWFGTGGNGLYLISNDNIHQLQHFTKDNSPLISNNINSLALNEATGEMFIATDMGLCSFTSQIPSADEGMTKDNVYAYPNPVRPDYTGAITITGLEDNASVKIATSSGALVNEGTASGGQYKWYGLDNNGKRVASGVYMVEVATSEGEKGIVCKIAIIK